jgi:hypothetical protein
MQISPINSVGLKGKNYDVSCQTCEKAIDLSEKLSDTFVKSDDIKTPGQIAAAVAINTLKTFVIAAGSIAAVNKLSGGKLAPLFEQGLKKGSTIAVDVAGKLTKNNGKFKKVTNFAGKTLEKAEGVLHNAYKKIATEKVEDKVVHNAAKGLSRTFGLGVATAHLFDITKRDNNNDGVKQEAAEHNGKPAAEQEGKNERIRYFE